MSEQEQEQDTQQSTESRDETLGDGGKRALESERAARKEAEKLAKQWETQFQELQSKSQQLGEEHESKLQEMQSEFDSLTKERDGLKHNLWVREVAAKNDFPPQLADRLRGETEEELVEDMKNFESVSRRPAPVPEAGTRSTPRLSTSDQFGGAMEQLFNR